MAEVVDELEIKPDNLVEYELLMAAKAKGKTDGNGPADVNPQMVRSMEHGEEMLGNG